MLKRREDAQTYCVVFKVFSDGDIRVSTRGRLQLVVLNL
jgi:hypothetical protein